MDFGRDYGETRVITREPPTLGAPYRVLVPQVDADGNDVGGIPLPEVAVPLGTHTGWNVTEPQLAGFRYLAGLVGAFVPFARTREARLDSGDARRSIARGDRFRRAAIHRSWLAAGGQVVVPDAALAGRRLLTRRNAIVATLR
jgi:hypothetical protein